MNGYSLRLTASILLIMLLIQSFTIIQVKSIYDINTSIVKEVIRKYKWYIIEKYANVYVIKNLFWEKWNRKYLNVAICDFMGDYGRYDSESINELKTIYKELFGVDPAKDMMRKPTRIHYAVIYDVEKLFDKYQITIVNSPYRLVYKNVIVYPVYMDTHLTEEVIKEINNIIAKKSNNTIKIAIKVLPLTKYMDSPDFRAKLYYAMTNVTRKYPELHMTLGLVREGPAVFILDKKPSLPLEEIAMLLRRELKDNTTPFILFYDVFGEGLKEISTSNHTEEVVSTNTNIDNTLPINKSSIDDNLLTQNQSNIKEIYTLTFITLILIIILSLVYLIRRIK